MKILFETSDFGEALVVRAKLEQAGFLVHLDNYNWGCAEPYLGLALGYRIWGVDTDADEAADLIGETGPRMADYEAIDVCPSCSSDEVLRFRSIVWLPVFWAIGIFLLPSRGNKRVCVECGRKFKRKGPALTGPMKILLTIWLAYIIAALAAGHIWTPELAIPWVSH